MGDFTIRGCIEDIAITDSGDNDSINTARNTLVPAWGAKEEGVVSTGTPMSLDTSLQRIENAVDEYRCSRQPSSSPSFLQGSIVQFGGVQLNEGGVVRADRAEEKGAGDDIVEIGEDPMKEKEVPIEERLAPTPTSVEGTTEHEPTSSSTADEPEPTIQQPPPFKIDPKSYVLSMPETDRFRSPTTAHMFHTQNPIAFTPPPSEDWLERQCCCGATSHYESALFSTSLTKRDEIGVERGGKANGDGEVDNGNSEDLCFGERKQLRRNRKGLGLNCSLGSVDEMPEVDGGDCVCPTRDLEEQPSSRLEQTPDLPGDESAELPSDVAPPFAVSRDSSTRHLRTDSAVASVTTSPSTRVNSLDLRGQYPFVSKSKSRSPGGFDPLLRGPNQASPPPPLPPRAERPPTSRPGEVRMFRGGRMARGGGGSSGGSVGGGVFQQAHPRRLAAGC